MAKLKNPVRFSTQFDFPLTRLKRLGAFDPILNADTPLFIDPLLLETSHVPEMRAAHVAWVDRFLNIITVLSAVKAQGDLSWRTADRLMRFPEVAGTCLGYGASIAGRGIGRELRERLLTTAKTIVDLGVDNPELFVLLPLIEDDIGPDRISDMTTGIIGNQLADYTRRVLGQHQIPLEEFRIGGARVHLPPNPTAINPTPVILVPKDVLRDLPIASNWGDVARISAQNDDHRARVNRMVGDIWLAKNRRDKADLRARVLANGQAVRTLLEAVMAGTKTPYNMIRDEDGVVNWLEDAYSAATANPVRITRPNRKTAGNLDAVVKQIIAQFRILIEANGMWKLLYVGNEHRPEKYSQMLFFAIAQTYCHENDVDISPETDSGGGPVDFKFSVGSKAKVIVEIKLSSNTRLRHGYFEQLETYKEAERPNKAYFLVLNVGRGETQVEAVQTLAEEAERNGDAHSIVEVVDATRKRSASRR